MDRLVKVDVKEVKMRFTQAQKCSSSFMITNLMHTMSVAISLTTSNPNFTLSTPLSLLPPLSSSAFTLRLTRPLSLPPLSSPPDTLTVRSSPVPSGKADLNCLFTNPRAQIVTDAVVPITLVGPHVVEFLFCPLSESLEIAVLLSGAVSGCHVAELDSLLCSAARCGYSYFVASLIDAGADPNYREGNLSILSLAIKSGDLESVRTIIESGYSIDPSDRLLHDAAEIGRLDLMRLLCIKFQQIEFNLTDSLGRTVLHIATIRANFDTIKFLISIGCEPDIEDSQGLTALHYAALEGDIELVDLLVNSSKYSKYCVSKNGDTPFSLALKRGHFQIYDLLSLRDALHRAAWAGDVREIKRCLGDGAKVNSRDENGWTPLHRAAFKGRIECVKVLLNYGARIDGVENGGRSAVQLAREAGHLQVVSCLKAYGAKASGKFFKGFGMSKSGLDRIENRRSLVTRLSREKEKD